MGWMADVWGPGGPRGDPPYGDQAPILRQLLEERPRSRDLLSGRAPIRRLRPRMRGDDVPAESVECELRKDAPHNCRCRLSRSAPGQLALRGKRQAGHARAAVAGRFADEQDGGVRHVLEVRGQPLAPEPRGGSLPIEVEGRADASGRKAGYEP